MNALMPSGDYSAVS